MQRNKTQPTVTVQRMAYGRDIKISNLVQEREKLITNYGKRVILSSKICFMVVYYSGHHRYGLWRRHGDTFDIGEATAEIID